MSRRRNSITRWPMTDLLPHRPMHVDTVPGHYGRAPTPIHQYYPSSRDHSSSPWHLYVSIHRQAHLFSTAKPLRKPADKYSQ